MRRLVYLSILLYLFFSCTPQKESGTANIGDIPASELSKLPMKWPTSKLPLNIYIAEEYHTDIDGAYLVSGKNLFQQMMDQWNLADSSINFYNTTSNLSTPNIDASSLNNYIDSTIGIYKKSNSWFANIGYGVLAVTSYLGVNRGSYVEMIHGDIIVNEYMYDYTLTESIDSKFDLPSVLLHELGHLIGLKHTSSLSIPSVMQPEISTSDDKRTLRTYDINSVNSLYASNSLALSSSGLALTADDYEEEPTYVQGYIELRANGECRHYINGKLVKDH